MNPTEILTGKIEKINPIDVLKYDVSHEKVTKIHKSHIDNVSVPGVVKRAEEETKKMVKKRE